MKNSLLIICSLVFSVFTVNAQPSMSVRVAPLIFGSGGSSVSISVPPIHIQQPPTPPKIVVLTPSQASHYDGSLHDYCAAYKDNLYSKCVENMRRQNQTP